MKYVCLVYGEEKDLYALTVERGAKLDADSLAYDRSLDQEGKLIIAQALQSVRTSKSVRRRKGKRLVTDGPFAETKEQLLGFVMVEADNLDEALDIAAGIPLAELGTVEVRAIYDIPGS
ncbi:YciI family protein [Mesorhizobium japonicum]|uniref:Mll4253 protein n=1 Tax=Mesorhizobium japonicum (strain LMG 29417 / CECT 9101 / MAFF 303099) TaxID=266835 RepID=Q98EG6_RHILO|nr:YciI family protein [Mesorhizobium japonicum]BAB50953.1 mll4253 [Mesorhizobium japonicum MAFF 303099]